MEFDTDCDCDIQETERQSLVIHRNYDLHFNDFSKAWLGNVV